MTFPNPPPLTLAAALQLFAAPPAIGSSTPNTGAFTTLTATSANVAGNIRTNSGTPPSFAGVGSIIASVPDAGGTGGENGGAILHAQIGDNANAFGGFSLGYGTAINWLLGVSKGIADTTAFVFYENGLAAQGRFYIATGGNIGIGVFPTTKLHVQAGNQYQSIRLQSTNSIGAGIQLQPSAAGGRNWLLLSTANGAATGGGLFVIWDETGGGPRVTVNSSGFMGVGVNSAATALQAVNNDVTMNAVVNVLTLGKNVASTGVGANGLGGALVMQLESSTTVDINAARMRWLWIDATQASRKARGVLSAYDTAERDAIMWEASGSAAMVGFLGAAPVIRQTTYTQTYSTTTATVNPSSISAFTGIDNAQAGSVYATVANLNTLRTDLLQAMQLINQLIDNNQAYGLAS